MAFCDRMPCKSATTKDLLDGHLQHFASAFNFMKMKLFNKPYISIGAPPMDAITYSTARAKLAA